MINKGLFTSNSEDWETPQDLFNELNREFDFKIDVCADKKNTKCKKYWTKKDNALSKDWTKIKGWKWMNPPYGREIKDWIAYAHFMGKTVCLLPARTDTKWFHSHIYGLLFRPDIRFIKGRLKFSGSKNSAPFPSMIVIFK